MIVAVGRLMKIRRARHGPKSQTASDRDAGSALAWSLPRALGILGYPLHRAEPGNQDKRAISQQLRDRLLFYAARFNAPCQVAQRFTGGRISCAIGYVACGAQLSCDRYQGALSNLAAFAQPSDDREQRQALKHA